MLVFTYVHKNKFLYCYFKIPNSLFLQMNMTEYTHQNTYLLMDIANYSVHSNYITRELSIWNNLKSRIIHHSIPFIH